MSFMVAAGAIGIVVFLLSYIRPGRFGVATLALGAGYILADLWAGYIADTYGEDLSAVLGAYSWHEVLYLVIALFPALFILVLSRPQGSLLPRTVGSLALVVLATTVVLPVLSITGVMDDQSRTLYSFVESRRNAIVAIILIVGLLDVTLAKPSHPLKPSKD